MGAGVLRSYPFLTLEFQWLIVCVFVPAVCVQWNRNLSAYETAYFDNPIKPGSLPVTTRLDHFTLHPDTGDIYVGAVNYLYRLNKNLVQAANVSTATCTGQTCLNYNKVLVLQDGRLVTCGSENGGRCQSRREGDLMEDRRGDVEEGGTIPQVAAFGKRTTASIVTKATGVNDDRLYVAASYSEEDGYRGKIPPISRRTLGDGDFMSAGDNDEIAFTSDYKFSSSFTINYVSVFLWNGFTYFATFQGTRIPQGDPYASKIFRVCHGSEDLDSYSEIFIQCIGPGSSIFSLVQAVYVGPAGPHLSESLALDATDQVLYAVFAKNQGSVGNNDVPIEDSAVCVYKMRDIETEFEDAVRGCLTNRDGNEIAYLHGSFCDGGLTESQIIPYIDDLLCQARITTPPVGYRYATGMAPGLSSMAATQLPGHLASSIITSIELNHTVAFIGTSQGQLLKVHIESGSFARLYENVSLEREPVMRDTKLNETTKELYVLTEQKLIKMRVENCSQYSSCEECIGTEAGIDGDPYCGWCTLERRCTRHQDCPLPDVSTRWLAYNDAQCIKITEVAPQKNSLPITLTDQQITLKVQKLPDLLDGQHYVCRFGDQFDDQAITTGETLQCVAPPGNRIPDILSPEDHVTIVLSVMSTETTVEIADIDFSFYECNTHKTCLSCVNSNWACDWCVFETRCTHDSSTCTGGTEIIITGRNNQNSMMEGPDACPQLQAQDGEVLVPNAVSRAIAFNVFNLPEPSLISEYRCSLHIEGSLQSEAATRVGSTLTCDPRAYTYTANEQELNVTLMAHWTDVNSHIHLIGDRHGFKVTLYKCEVLRPDCSRCVSEETSRAELGCVWCGASEGTCWVSDSEACLNAVRIVTPDNMLNCPDPVIQEVYPLYGPIEGNTRLTLTGTDLGRRFSDLRGVTVGGQLCDLTGQEVYYSTGGSVSCITGRSSDFTPQSLQMTIYGVDGTDQSSQEDQTFQYKDPVITDFSPKVGPQSGGTIITISGENLDTGRSIQASVDDIPCRVERSQISDFSITCLTSRADNLGSWTLSVSFDGAERSAGVDYRYAKDPEVNSIQPSSSVLAGGRELNVSGSGFSVIQQPQILITQRERKFIENCRVEGDTIMHCTSPRIDLPNQVLGDSILNVTTGFIMDGVADLLTWCDLSNKKSCTPVEYFQNPEYYPFTDVVYTYENGIGLKDGDILLIEGERLDLAVTSAEVIVYIGPDFCTGVIVNRRALSCLLPENEPIAGDYLGMNTSKGLPVIWVIHGTTLAFNIGYFRYPNMTPTVIIACVVSVTLLLIFMVIVLTVLYIKYYKQKKSLRQYHERLLCEIRAIHEEFRKSANRNKQPSSTAERENTENVRPSSKSQSKNIMLSDKVRIMPEDVKISYNQLKMGRVLGQGAFGKVYKAVLKDYQAGSQSEVAVKTIQDVNDPTNTVKFLEEGLLMKNFNHPNVLGLLGLTFNQQGQPLIVLPFMANGDLKSYLVRRKKDLAPIQLVMFALHVALGMEYLAQQKFVHRDLAARNCMIDEELVVKIADFGLSRDLEESDYYTSGDKQAKLPIKWMAPESMERRVYTTKTDVWSYGVLLWEVFSGGSKPYPGMLNRDLFTYLKQGQRMNPPKFCPRKIGEIMQHCWQDNPKMRCSFQEIVTKLKDLVETMHDDAAPEMGQGSSLKVGEPSSLAKEKAAELTDELQEKSKGVDRSSYLIPLTAMESVKVNCGSSSEETDQQYTHSYTNISGV